MFEAWLTARNVSAMRSHWRALGASRHTLTWDRSYTLHGCAVLAEAMLGERADWIIDHERQPSSDHLDHESRSGVMLDDAWDVDIPSREIWDVWERRTTARGVQVVRMQAGTLEGQPSGGAQTVVRIFDEQRAASVAIASQVVSTIGEIDLAPLDLLAFSRPLRVQMPATLDVARSLLAQIVADFDAHYDTSADWPVDGRVATDGTRSVTLEASRLAARVELAWGSMLELSLFGSVRGVLPSAAIDRVVERIATLERDHPVPPPPPPPPIDPSDTPEARLDRWFEERKRRGR